MCIIAVKNKGINTINWEEMQTCFENNSDGAGYMFTVPEMPFVKIKKGFVKYKPFEKSLKADIEKWGLEKMSIVAHFRIGTHGNNSAQNTHPYKISRHLKDLELLETTASMGVCMNGILYNVTLDKKARHNDTMQYIIDTLYTLKSLKKDFLSNTVIDYIEKETACKWAFLKADGTIQLIGSFNSSGEWLYSNYSYEDWNYLADYGNLKSSSKYKGLNSAISETIAWDWLDIYDGYFVTDTGEYIDCNDELLYISSNDIVYIEKEGTYKKLNGNLYSYQGNAINYDTILCGE